MSKGDSMKRAQWSYKPNTKIKPAKTNSGVVITEESVCACGESIYKDLGGYWHHFIGDMIWCPKYTAAPLQPAAQPVGHSHGSDKDPSPLPVDEKFTLWLDEEGDYMIQAQRQDQAQYLTAHGSTPEDAVWSMRKVLDLAQQLKPVAAQPVVEAEQEEDATFEDVRRSIAAAHNLINDWNDPNYGQRAIEAQDILNGAILSIIRLESKPAPQPIHPETVDTLDRMGLMVKPAPQATPDAIQRYKVSVYENESESTGRAEGAMTSRSDGRYIWNTKKKEGA